MKARRAELKALSDVIGHEKDLAEFRKMVADEDPFDAETRAVLGDVVWALRSDCHRRGRPLGERLFAEQPDRLVDRVGTYRRGTHEYEPA